MTDKPFSPSCERNREPILAVLREQFAARRRVLEVGSGSGQHAVHFAAAMPWLTWQCSDVAGNLPGIRAWLDDARLANTPPPIELDVARAAPMPVPVRFDALFSANTLHIMGWPEVEAFFAMLPAVLDAQATVVVYGPFNYDGAYTSDSNREFDGWLQARDPRSRIRDFEAVDAQASKAGLRLLADFPMPANNRCLVWQRG
jgi:cyclopropane fatty-acyl-phospholipid synthase-like methyltransferase